MRARRGYADADFIAKLNRFAIQVGEPPTWIGMPDNPNLASHGSGVFCDKQTVMRFKNSWEEYLKWKMGQAREEGLQVDRDKASAQQAAALNKQEAKIVADLMRKNKAGDRIIL